ncbi:MAG: hypothetical protein Fur002_04460 [Anaerolineales bacterium]
MSDLALGDYVEVFLDEKFGEFSGWRAGQVFAIEPYSQHRSFYWVRFTDPSPLDMKEISVFNPKHIRKNMPPTLFALLEQAIALRAPRMENPAHENAFRLFNGFYEGEPSIAIDVYARTLLIHNYAEESIVSEMQAARQIAGVDLQEIVAYLRNALNWLHAGMIKYRNSPSPHARRGAMLFGESLDDKICEHGAWYALDLTMNRDASFYLDTELLRKWLIEHCKGKSVLNTFAYTGSFGVAARYGGATRVTQIDLNRKFLALGQRSYGLNRFPLQKGDFIARDFFEQVGNFKRDKKLFDIVIIDPPFFSSTPKGTVNQEAESARLINKVRPLIADGGTLIAVNNALYVSGAAYMQTLESLCADGYLSIRELIPAPDDFIGNKKRAAITDSAPFNHSTKIAVLDVKKK